MDLKATQTDKLQMWEPVVQSTDQESKTQASDAAPGVPGHPVGKGTVRGTVSVKGEESQEGVS